MFSKRLHEPALQPEDLPPLDAEVLSHLHGDHFDRTARARLDRSVPILTTPRAARRLTQWGFEAATDLANWQHQTVDRGTDRVMVTAVPGRHGPAGFHRLMPPVMGTVISDRTDRPDLAGR